MNFEDTPPGLRLHTGGNAREFADDGELIARARDGEKRSSRGPGRNGRIGCEARDGEAFGQQSGFEAAGRGWHCELEETPDKAAIDRDGNAVDIAGTHRSEERDHRR